MAKNLNKFLPKAGDNSVEQLFEILKDPLVDSAKIEAFSNTSEGRTAWSSMVAMPTSLLTDAIKAEIRGSATAVKGFRNNIYLNPLLEFVPDFTTAEGMNEIINDQTLLDKVFNNATYWADFKASTALTSKQVPKMTSATAPEGAVTQSSQLTSYEGWKAFNRDNTTIKLNWLSTSGSITNQWVGYEFIAPMYIHTVEVQATDYANQQNTTVKNAIIQYSDDGTNWSDALTTVYHGSDNTIQYTPISVAGRHKYWRMFCLDNNGNAKYTGIGELQFKGFE